MRGFYKIHKRVTITADLMFVSGVPFFGDAVKKIKFRTTQFLPNRTARTLADSLTKVIMLYARGGFIVNLALMDKVFDAIKEFLPFLEGNTAAAREHVGEIERDIQQIKERVRCTTSKFPFKNIPTMVLINTMYNLCLWLNAFPIRFGITGGFSPRELITGLTVNFKDHCKFDVGGYVEASTDAVITNDNSDRTHACIFLGPSGNRQGLLIHISTEDV